MAGVDELRLRGLDRLAEDLVGPAGVVADAVDRVANVAALGPVERLAVVERLERGQDVDVLLHEVGELCEVARALDTRRVEAPGGVERLVCRHDGEVDILGRALGDARRDLAVCWVEDTAESGGWSADSHFRPVRGGARNEHDAEKQVLRRCRKEKAGPRASFARDPTPKRRL